MMRVVLRTRTRFRESSGRFKIYARSTQQIKIFNEGKIDLNYSMLPERTISSQPHPGRKKGKKRRTVLVFENSSGSKKLCDMIILNTLRPAVLEIFSVNKISSTIRETDRIECIPHFLSNIVVFLIVLF